MTLQVLISCMHQKDHSIIERSNIQTDVVVVNQCDENREERFTFTNQRGMKCNVLFISTTQRGLSRSRNMAIANASADICLICDDDEIFENDYETIILDSYKENKKADIIAFRLKGITYKTFSSEAERIKFPKILKIASQQISFRLNKIKSNGISFDEKMGSGSGNGSGEENKFLLDCLKHQLKILYVPRDIVTINGGSESMWFEGYTQEFFRNRGWSNKHMLGFPIGLLYSLYWAFSHQTLYSNESSLFKAIKNLTIGSFQNR